MSVIAGQQTHRRRPARLAGWILCLALSACSSLEREPREQRGAAGEEGDEVELERRVSAAAHFAAGLSAELNEDTSAAVEHYLRSAEADPSHERLVLDLARRLLRSNESSRAVELLTRASTQPGASGEVWALLGLALAESGRPDEAVRASEQATRVSPGSLSGYRSLYFFHRDGRRWQEAAEVLDRALAQTTDVPEFWVSLAELYANLGQLHRDGADDYKRRALRALDRAVELKSPDLGLLIKVADGYKLMGEYRRAEPLYIELLDRCPPLMQSVMQLREKLAQVYAMTERRAEAEDQLKRALKDNPRNVPVLQFLATLASQQERYPEAIDYLQQAVVVRPELEELYYELAGLFLSTDRPAEALVLVEKVRARFPATFLLEYFTAMSHVGLKRYALAVHHFEEAERRAEETERSRLTHVFYFQFGAALERQGDVPRAERYLRKCLELAPDFDEALNYLGYMWADRGEHLDEARAFIERALKAEPENPAYLDSLGWVLFRQGKLDEARKWLQLAVEKSEEPDATLFDHLADVCAAQGDVERAREYWRRSLELEENEKVRKKADAAVAPASPPP